MKTRFLSSASIGPLTRKVTLILVLLVLLPSVLLSNYIYQTLAQSYMSRVINERQQMLNQTTSQIDAMFRSMQNKCRYIAENNVVVSFLRKGNLVDYPIYTKHHIEDTISLLRYTFEYQIVSYRDICIFSDTPSLPENSVLHPEKKLSSLLLYVCPMFVAASHRRGTSHCLSCTMERQWPDGCLQEHLARNQVSQPAFPLCSVRFVQVEHP